MILFLGTRVKRSVLGTGSFHCPNCRMTRGYEQIETRNWIHVFWLRIVPLGAAVQSVQCTACGAEWEPSVLHAVPSGAVPWDSPPSNGVPSGGVPWDSPPSNGVPSGGVPWDTPPTPAR